MTTLARFVRGSNKIDLDEVTYYLGDDFKPPNPEREFNMASGTSLNRTGGASLVGTRSVNRDVDFTVNVKGTTEAACIASARRLASFVMSGGDLFFEIQLTPGLPEPLWGQFGSWLKYEVVTAIAKVNDRYGRFGVSAKVHAQVVISLQVKPYALGTRQRLVNAAGYMFENNLGSADGTAKSLAIQEATTNKMTNPVLGHATFGNGWTAGSSVIATKNTDAAFCLPGLTQSAKLVSLAATNNTYTQSIAAGNTNKHSFSALVCLPDGGTPTTADFDIYYGAAKSTTYQSLGNGLYLAHSDNIDGISAATATGIVVKAGRTVYLLGYQMEEKAYHTPVAYGDLLGCAWTGTAHASTSTRTATNINATIGDDLISLAEGAVSIVWKPYQSNTFGTDRTLFGLYKTDYAASGLRGYFEESDDKFYLTDGTNTISTAAQTFAAGDTLYLTFTWGPGGLNIYKSGASAATGATYTPATAANQAVLAIGQANAATVAHGDILGFDVYDAELTAAQALALYTAQAAIVAGGGRVSSIPWLWTKDGDGVVDNCDDANRDNWCVAGGVPGSEEALTKYKITPSSMSKAAYWLLKSEEDRFILPLGHNYLEFGVTADAGCSNADYDPEVTSGSGVVEYYNSVLLPEYYKGNVHAFGRLAHVSGTGTFSAYPFYQYQVLGTTYNGKSFPIAFAAGATFYNFYFGLMNLSLADDNDTRFSTLYLGIEIPFAGADQGTRLDYLLFVHGEAVKISGGSGGTYLVLEENKGYRATSVGYFYDPVTIFGDAPINVSPSKYNTLWFIIGDNQEASTITDTAAFEVSVTPRWSLL